jgi:hypothetical protein
MSTASTSTNPFDLGRISKSKREVDLSPNTIRAYAGHGLRLHKVGKAVFFSRSELSALITSGALATSLKNHLN